MAKSKKLGVALGSGGGRGLVHIGVLRSLQKHNIEIDYLAGASIGSLVAAMFSSLKDPAEIEKRIFDSKWKTLGTLIDPTLFSGGAVSGGKLENLIAEFVGKENFEELAIPLSTVASDLISGEEVVSNEGDLAKAVHASMSVPSVFKPVKMGDKLLVDGGIINPVPSDVVREMGADIVLAVNLDHRKNNPSDKTNYRLMTSVTRRTINIMRHYLAEYSTRDADLLLEPVYDEQSLMSLSLYTDSKKAQGIIDMGERLMDEKIGELQDLLA